MTEQASRKSGVALIVVLYVSLLLTLLVHSFLRTMLVEYSLAIGLGQEKQAEQLACSGIEKGIAVLAADTTPEGALTETWANSETDFREHRVGDGFFTLLRPTFEESPERYYGAIDEASKVNINVAAKDILMKIPGMTEEIADSILDWRDEDENPRPAGAESSYYLLQDPPYRAKNQAFETVEELLFVRGVTPDVLYGNDKNQNGVRDPFEPQEGDFKPGLLAYVTVWSYEADVAADGQPRVNLNTATNQDLRNRLGDTLDGQIIQNIQIYRVANAARGAFRSVAHLLEVGGMTKDLFKKSVDRCTILPPATTAVPGLVNVNTAPRKVLEAIPGMKPEMAQRIVEYRTQQGADLSNIGWLTDVLKNDELQAIANYLTVRSFQFRFDAVGIVYPEGEKADRARPFRRFTAVYDKLADPPRLLYWKDWSRFGVPYEVSVEK